jgi:hypothetical protein
VARYRDIYGGGSYAPQALQREISARVAVAARRYGIGRAHMPDHRGIPADPAPATPPRPPAEQLSLL